MGLFTPNYLKPGPGVSPDAPRKKGLARLFELLGRDFADFFRAGLLALLGIIPFIVLVVLSIETHAVLFVLLAGLAGGIAAPQICSMADTVLRSLRDEPGFWWQTYRRVWKRNLKATLLPGVVFGLVLATQLFTLFHLSAFGAGTTLLVMLIVSLILSFGLFTYVWPQVALLELSFAGVMKNAVLLFMGYLPRSLGAVAVQLVYWGAVVLFFPVSTILLPLASFWLPMVPSLLIIYPALEKSFNVEATIKQMRDAQLEPDEEK